MIKPAQTILLLLAVAGVGAAQISLSGKVVDKNGAAISGAQVKLKAAGLTTATSAQGDFALSGATLVQSDLPVHSEATVTSKTTATTSYYTLRGERLSKTSFQESQASSQMGLLCLVQGGKASVKHLVFSGVREAVSEPEKSEARSGLGKTLAVVDTLEIAKSGYLTRSIPISSYTGTRPADTLYDNNFNLAAIDVWENITPPGTSLSDNGSVSIMVDPKHAGTAYTSVYAQGIYKTTNCGNTWVKINTGRNGSVLNSGGQWSMQIDPINPLNLYAINTYGSNTCLFKSTNGGVDWDPCWGPGSEIAQVLAYGGWVQIVTMDLDDPQHLFVSFHENCSGPYGPMCMADTRDGGSTWRLFKGPAGGWVEGGAPFITGPTNILYGDYGDLWYSGDNGSSWSKVADGGHHQMYRSSNGTWYAAGQNGINRSTNRGATWTDLPNSPNGVAVIGDGKRLFTGWAKCCGTPNIFSTATEGIDTDWKPYNTNMTVGDAVWPAWFAYDHNTHVLYATVGTGGLWRVKTQ